MSPMITFVGAVLPCDKSGLALYEPELDDLRIFALEGAFSDEELVTGQLGDQPGLNELINKLHPRNFVVLKVPFPCKIKATGLTSSFSHQ